MKHFLSTVKYAHILHQLLLKVNTIQDTMKHHYDKVKMGMPVFMDDIAVIGIAGNIRKGIQNCRRLKIEKKMIHGLN